MMPVPHGSPGIQQYPSQPMSRPSHTCPTGSTNKVPTPAEGKEKIYHCLFLEPDRTFKVARVRVGPKVSGQKSSPSITAVVILPGAPFPFPSGMWPRHDARTPPKSRHTAVSQPAHVPSEPHLSNRIDQESSNSCRRKEKGISLPIHASLPGQTSTTTV